MGTAQAALVAVALLAAGDARAESCTGITASGGRFAKCFDLGNRFSVTAGSDGFGGSVKLRHLIRFDDEPDLVWKLEHNLTEVTWGAWQQQLDARLYRGRFLRHARDGHIVLPFGIPKKIFLPFDIGAEASVGQLRYRPYAMREDQLQVGVVEIAALVDFARTRGNGRRFTLGPVVRWDIDVDRTMGRIGKVSEHEVAPFTVGMANLHFETVDGLWAGDLRAEAGTVWHTNGGWKPQAEAEATLERIMIAINDRPIAVTAGVAYMTEHDEAIARVGLRAVLVHRNDKRVNLRPLSERRTNTHTPPPKPVVAPPVVVPPASTPKPAGPKPASDKPVSDKPASDKPASDKPTTGKPATDKPSSDKPSSEQPSSDKRAGDKPASDKPTGDKPTTDKPTTDEPPATEKPATDRPTTDKPTTDKPTTDEPAATDEPTTDNPPPTGGGGGDGDEHIDVPRIWEL